MVLRATYASAFTVLCLQFVSSCTISNEFIDQENEAKKNSQSVVLTTE